MANLKLWDMYEDWKVNYRWVDLTHELSPQTPHWVGWDPLSVEVKADLDSSIFSTHAYTTVGQYGTHVDAPCHMVKGARSLENVEIEEMIMPLCVIDKSEAVRQNCDFIMQEQDIKEWEAQYGPIPKGAMVAFRSGWCKVPGEEMDNLDEDGNRHFPGWSLEAVKYLIEQREVASIGHETSDTDSPLTSGQTSYEVEYYFLSQNRIQLEMLTNLDQCPPVGALFFCAFPRVKGGSGFPARCWALCPKE